MRRNDQFLLFYFSFYQSESCFQHGWKFYLRKPQQRFHNNMNHELTDEMQVELSKNWLV